MDLLKKEVTSFRLWFSFDYYFFFHDTWNTVTTTYVHTEAEITEFLQLQGKADIVFPIYQFEG